MRRRHEIRMPISIEVKDEGIEAPLSPSLEGEGLHVARKWRRGLDEPAQPARRPTAIRNSPIFSRSRA